MSEDAELFFERTPEETEEKLRMFRNRLEKVYRHLSKQARRQGITCYRIYDHDIPEFPLRVEKYEDWFYVAEYRRNHRMSEEAHLQWMEECQRIISGVTGVAKEKIILRLRQRMSHRDAESQYEKLDEEKQYVTVHEQGLQFRINLTDYLDTGLFLDHRITRQMVREKARDKKVLNLFCYTGSFSVYAASGGAKEVVSVDLSRTYLAWATENMRVNDLLDPLHQQFVPADVKQYLDSLPRGEFDLVVMDPPTFSNSKRMKDFLDIQRDHPELIQKVLAAMTPGGELYFSTNFSRFQLQSAAIRGAEIRDITRATTSFDFQGRLSRYCFLITKNT